MKVLILSNGADNGGVGIGIKRAFAKHAPDWQVNSVTRVTNFIGFEPDVFWPPGADGAVVDALWKEADVVHIMDKFEAASMVAAYDEEKPRIMHHHGSIFRSNPLGFIERSEQDGIIQLVATFDLLRFAPSVLRWMPHPVDIERMQQFRETARRHKRITVVHTPGAGYNGTDHLWRATEGIDVSLDIVKDKPWAEAMERKARADILFDSMDIGYGMTSVEAFAMGLAVIAGGDPDTEERIIGTIGYLPYLSAFPGTLSGRILALVASPQDRGRIAALGWQAANDFHAEVRVVERLKEIYLEAHETWG